MKRTLALIFISLFSITITSAQTKTATKLGKTTKFSHSDSLMCNKKWKVTMVEEWGVASKPSERNQKDMLFMSFDGNFYLVLFGVNKAGTWVRTGQNINFTDTSGEKFSYKVLTIDPKKLKVDHYSDAEGHSIFEMEEQP
jgi:hypothetical protein